MILFSDEQLALGVQRGRAEDLTRLVERHHAPLLGFLHRLTGGDLQLAEDLVQETFLRLLARIDTYQPERPFKPWLYAIAVNQARDHFKRADRRRTESLPEEFEPISAVTPETDLLERLQVDRVATALGELPLPQREAILLRYTRDFSLQQVAALQQVPVGTVKSRLCLGLRRLKERLDGEE